MTENREALCNGLSYAAWGYLFLNLDVNIQQVSILPRFAGFYLLLQAINRLAAERRDLKLLRPLCALLMIWSAGDWLMSWAGLDLDGRFLFFDLLVGAAGLYFHFQFLTDLAALAQKFQPPDWKIDQAICKRRTVYVVLAAALSLLGYLPDIMDGLQKLLVYGMAFAACVAGVLIMVSLFQLQKYAKISEEAAG